MPVKVRLPTLLRPHAKGQTNIEANGATLGEVFDDITTQYPTLGEQLKGDDGEIRKFMNVYVNDDDARFIGKLQAPVKDGDSISILPAVAGG